MTERVVLGVDFGTESGRVLVVDVATGDTVSTAVRAYPHGVIDQHLPGDDRPLPPHWALQDPEDYLLVLREAVPEALAAAGVKGEQVIGLGVDCTSCTMLPTTADGRPLCTLPPWRHRPHAWVKLWKHHAAQPEADEINRVAQERGEDFVWRYGGRQSAEWFYPKALQILREDPEVYAAADRLIEATDWIVWQLTGREVRSTCPAGYKAIWRKGVGYPSREFFAAVDPGLADIAATRMQAPLLPPASRAGGLTPRWAEALGLPVGLPVAVGGVDAHVVPPAVGVVEPGNMVLVMGTSICHMVLGREAVAVPGIAGVVEDGILPGLEGYEAGQNAAGDILAWFAGLLFPGAPEQRGAAFAVLEEEASRVPPGSRGLVALDWWNGNRSILMNAHLSGLLVGMTLSTGRGEVYRALLESIAYGTRVIVDTLRENGVAVHELYATGGLAARSPLLMQILSDVTGMPLHLSTTPWTSALGAAMHGAVAAGPERGGYRDLVEAAAHMAHVRRDAYLPDPQRVRAYARGYGYYRELHDLFGRGGTDLMQRLAAWRRELGEPAGGAEQGDAG